MSPCCGRPNNRANKLDRTGAAAYYERFAYLSSHQKDQQLAAVGTKCPNCDALTLTSEEGKCAVCGNPKPTGEENS